MYSVLLSFLERNRIFFAEIHHRCLSLTAAAAAVEVGVVLGAVVVLFDYEPAPAPRGLALGKVLDRIIFLDYFAGVAVVHVQSVTETARAGN